MWSTLQKFQVSKPKVSWDSVRFSTTEPFSQLTPLRPRVFLTLKWVTLFKIIPASNFHHPIGHWPQFVVSCWSVATQFFFYVWLKTFFPRRSYSQNWPSFYMLTFLIVNKCFQSNSIVNIFFYVWPQKLIFLIDQRIYDQSSSIKTICKDWSQFNFFKNIKKEKF